MRVLFKNGFQTDVRDEIAAHMAKTGEAIIVRARPSSPKEAKAATAAANAALKGRKASDVYKAQIFALEKKLAEAIAAVPLAEKALAEAYAGGDPAGIEKAHSVLTRARDSRVASLAALRETDRLYGETFFAERKAKEATIREEGEAAYWTAEPEIRKTGAALAQILRKFDDSASAETDMEAQLVTPFLDRVWNAIQVRIDPKIKALPEPKRMPERDDEGRMVFKEV